MGDIFHSVATRTPLRTKWWTRCVLQGNMISLHHNFREHQRLLLINTWISCNCSSGRTIVTKKYKRLFEREDFEDVKRCLPAPQTLVYRTAWIHLWDHFAPQSWPTRVTWFPVLWSFSEISLNPWPQESSMDCSPVPLFFAAWSSNPGKDPHLSSSAKY